MIYKPEYITDLEGVVIIAAQVHPGDKGDTEELTEGVAGTIGTLAEIFGEEHLERLRRKLGTDEGYFALEEIDRLQELEVRTVVADSSLGRRRENLSPEEEAVLHRSSRAVQSKTGKALLRGRSEHLERGFAHGLDHGGCRRATLRGTAKLTKRYLTAVLAYNLSILTRKLHQYGTPSSGSPVEGRSFRSFTI